ncbi:hypothetical protein Anapl_13573 [Anas platyrhynchos]|uniref:Uncharacterized protein n=1 Tax=Anas platyrhynchos TaxID=8839 RepID=R0L7A5_ANAPL|nr:hypothetical protein Anapl_13573 [Anas platyrhynchos]
MKGRKYYRCKGSLPLMCVSETECHGTPLGAQDIVRAFAEGLYLFEQELHKPLLVFLMFTAVFYFFSWYFNRAYEQSSAISLSGVKTERDFNGHVPRSIYQPPHAAVVGSEHPEVDISIDLTKLYNLEVNIFVLHEWFEKEGKILMFNVIAYMGCFKSGVLLFEQTCHFVLDLTY